MHSKAGKAKSTRGWKMEIPGWAHCVLLFLLNCMPASVSTHPWWFTSLHCPHCFSSISPFRWLIQHVSMHAECCYCEDWVVRTQLCCVCWNVLEVIIYRLPRAHYRQGEKYPKATSEQEEGAAARDRMEYQSGWLSYWSALPYSGCTVRRPPLHLCP